MDMGMGGAGAPPMGGGEMGGAGAPPMGGDMGGGAAPAGGAPAAAAAAAGGSTGKILTKSRAKDSQKKLSEKMMDEEQAMPSGTRLTSIEQVMYRILLNMNIPFKRFAQYPLGPYKADFAIPALQLVIECDGDQFHSNPEDVARDTKRDMELAGAGWTVIRFGETELEEKQEAVTQTLAQAIHKSWKRALGKQQQMNKAAESQMENLLKTYGAGNGETNS